MRLLALLPAPQVELGTLRPSRRNLHLSQKIFPAYYETTCVIEQLPEPFSITLRILQAATSAKPAGAASRGTRMQATRATSQGRAGLIRKAKYPTLRPPPEAQVLPAHFQRKLAGASATYAKPGNLRSRTFEQAINVEDTDAALANATGRSAGAFDLRTPSRMPPASRKARTPKTSKTKPKPAPGKETGNAYQVRAAAMSLERATSSGLFNHDSRAAAKMQLMHSVSRDQQYRKLQTNDKVRNAMRTPAEASEFMAFAPTSSGPPGPVTPTPMSRAASLLGSSSNLHVLRAPQTLVVRADGTYGPRSPSSAQTSPTKPGGDAAVLLPVLKPTELGSPKLTQLHPARSWHGPLAGSLPPRPATASAADSPSRIELSAFAGAVPREPQELLEPGVEAFTNKLREMQARIESRLQSYQSSINASRSSISAGALAQSKYGLGDVQAPNRAITAPTDHIHRQTGALSDISDSDDELGPAGAAARSRPSTAPAAQRPAGRLDTSPVQAKSPGARPISASAVRRPLDAMASPPRAVDPEAHTRPLRLNLADDLIQATEFIVQPACPAYELPPRPNTAVGVPGEFKRARGVLSLFNESTGRAAMTSTTTAWQGFVAPTARPQPTESRAASRVFSDRVVHQRSMRMVNAHGAVGGGAGQGIELPLTSASDAFRVGMLTVSADVRIGDVTLTIFDPAADGLRKRLIRAAQLSEVFPGMSSISTVNPVLKFKWWERQLHDIANQVRVYVLDDDSIQIRSAYEVAAENRAVENAVEEQQQREQEEAEAVEAAAAGEQQAEQPRHPAAAVAGTPPATPAVVTT